MDKTPPPTDSKKRKTGGVSKRKDYFGSRWAGLILLVITAIVSLVFYLRWGAADFFSAIFSPATYTIQK